jgi:hypothetical protein
MPENEKSYRTRVKEFVEARKIGLSVTATAIVTATLVAKCQKSALKEAYDFIDAAGLHDKFIDSVPYDEIYK